VLAALIVFRTFSKESAPLSPKLVGRPRPIRKKGPAPEAKFSVRIRQAATPLYENAVPLSSFPCVFGRNQHLVHGQIQQIGAKTFANILHDHKVSREHFEIRRRDNQFFLVSRGANGAIVNQQPVPKGEQAPLSLSGITTIEVGEQTKIELQPI
jgi:hypothetical protein